MTHETRKASQRRSLDSRFANRYFVGDGIDIGAGDDGLSRYRDLFPRIKSVRDWDMADGDAMMMHGVEDDTFDFVNSSHCLEHLRDPWVSFNNWLRICRPKGYLTIIVPDADLYEQGHWPSIYNHDHKWNFSIRCEQNTFKDRISIISLVESATWDIRVLKIELLDTYYRYGLRDIDQSMLENVEPAIEIVLQKL